MSLLSTTVIYTVSPEFDSRKIFFQHPSYRRNRTEAAVREFPQDKPFFCEKCFYGYDKQRQYEDHLKTHIKVRRSFFFWQ